MNKVDVGYYSTEKVLFEDHHANHVEKGFTRKFLIFINEKKFLVTLWKNKECLDKSDISSIQRDGEYSIEGTKIILTYRPNGWEEACTIIDEETIFYHYTERKMFFRKWKNKTDENNA